MTGIALLYLNPNEYLKESISLLIPSITVLLAAYYGAKFAYKFQEHRENNKERLLNENKGRKAVYKLNEVINNLANYEEQILDKVTNNPEINEGFYFIAIMPTEIEPMKVELDPYELLFLSVGDNVNLLPDYSIIKARYNTLLENIKLRSETQKRAQVQISNNVVSNSRQNKPSSLKIE